jgi:DNA topoisomerase-3
LYEKKYTTYPRVDTTYLSDDIYPKCGGILNGMSQYAALVSPLKGKKLAKRKKYFDSSKVTDHHAIIPTGVTPKGLSDAEQKVYDLVARHFIAVFYPDCQFMTTTVSGSVEKDLFRVTGKQIEEEGWHSVFAIGVKEKADDDDESQKEEECVLPQFVKGESGSHEPQLSKKMTTPPKPYTEATLLRAMETAGKSVEDETLRESMKENGIGRPSTRAAIIETLFRRRYIQKERKSIFSTVTGEELIDVIHEELLKSAELTGRWEKKLRDIENHKYGAGQFVDDMKQMVKEIVGEVLADNSSRRVAVTKENTRAKKSKSVAKPKIKTTTGVESIKEGDECPVCHKGYVIKGNKAFGCSQWKEGCLFRLPFEQ